MRFCLMTESQVGLDFPTLLALARTAEDAGFDGFFRADHLLSVTEGGEEAGTDAWAMLAGLAAATDRIRLGVRVSPVGWRHPGLLALTAATVDRMSGGRLEVGVGTGWNEREHEAYGHPFPDSRERFDRLEEALQILITLWTQERSTFTGRHYRLRDAPRCPTASVPHPPIVVGGAGPRRTPRLAARYAAEFNAFNASADDCAAAFQRVRDACRENDRDPNSLVYSQNLVIVVGEDEADFRRRADAMRRRRRETASLDDFLDANRASWTLGTVPEVIRDLERRAAAGVQRAVLQDELPEDLDMVRLLGRDVLPALI